MADMIRVTNGRWWYEDLVGKEFVIIRTFDVFEDASLDFPEPAYEVERYGDLESGVVLARDCVRLEGDAVEHPPHYNSMRVEVIDIIDDAVQGADPFEAVCQANIIKYILRYRHKNGAEDVKKAIWYAERLVAELEAEESKR